MLEKCRRGICCKNGKPSHCARSFMCNAFFGTQFGPCLVSTKNLALKPRQTTPPSPFPIGTEAGRRQASTSSGTQALFRCGEYPSSNIIAIVSSQQTHRRGLSELSLADRTKEANTAAARRRLTHNLPDQQDRRFRSAFHTPRFAMPNPRVPHPIQQMAALTCL